MSGHGHEGAVHNPLRDPADHRLTLPAQADGSPISPAPQGAELLGPDELAAQLEAARQAQTLTAAEQRGVEALRGGLLLGAIGRIAGMGDSIRGLRQSTRANVTATIEGAQARVESAGRFGTALGESASAAVSAARPAASAGARGLLAAWRESRSNEKARKQLNKATFAEMDSRSLRGRHDARVTAAVEAAGRDESGPGSWGTAILAARAHRAATKSAAAARKRDGHRATAEGHATSKRGHFERVATAKQDVVRPVRTTAGRAEQ